jgi:hypothetical protein
MRVRVKGGGQVAQIYAIRQAISKALVAYYQKCELPWNCRAGQQESSCLTCVTSYVITFVTFSLCRRRRSFQEGNQGHLGPVRSFLVGRRPEALRAEEVWRTWRSFSLPEVVPLNSFEFRRFTYC